MKTGWALAFGISGGLLGAGILFLITSPPRGQAVTLSPPPTPQPLVVHVSGGVVAPGVYALPVGSRVQDAILAAGGLLPESPAQGINLAARLQDGNQIHIPDVQPVTETDTASPLGGVLEEEVESLQPASPLAPVDINVASQAQLESLPGIGPATALKIIAYRQEHGPFASPADIQEVSGIGPATFERIRDLITAGNIP